jgi:hypothetical protein
MGQHQLAFTAGLPWDDAVFTGHHQFSKRNIGGHKVQIVLPVSAGARRYHRQRGLRLEDQSITLPRLLR